MELQGILHISKMWKVDMSKDQLIFGLKNCEVCQRHRRIKRNTKLSTLNTSTKPNDIIGMDFIFLINGGYLLVTMDFLSRRVQVDVNKSPDGGSVMTSP